MCEIPETDALGELVSIVSASKVTSVTNLILSHGNNLGEIKADAENTSGVTACKIANERPGFSIPYLHDRVVAATDNPLFVHAHASHKPSVGIRVTFEAEHASLTKYSTTSAGTQDNSVTTGFAHTRD